MVDYIVDFIKKIIKLSTQVLAYTIYYLVFSISLLFELDIVDCKV